MDTQNYKSSLNDIVAGDWVVMYSSGTYGRGPTLVQVTRSTKTQLIVGSGFDEKKFNRNGREVGKSGSWHACTIDAPLETKYDGTHLELARRSMEKERVSNMRKAIKAKVDGDVPTATLEEVAKLLGIEV